jgi:hypothetical protein
MTWPPRTILSLSVAVLLVLLLIVAAGHLTRPPGSLLRRPQSAWC